MTISKQNGPDGFQDGGELAGITAFGKQVPKVDPAVKGVVSGDVSKTSSGFLSLALEKVSEKAQGVYVCRAIILQEPTGTSDLTSRVKVAYKSPHIPGLLKRLDILESNVLGKIERLERMQSWLLARVTKVKYWVSEPWDGRRYYLSYDHVVDARASNEACEDLGGYLAEIDTKEEYEFIKTFIHTYPHPITAVMFGGTDEAKEGQWRNIHSGKPVGYVSWNKGQPDNAGGIEDCSEYILSSGAMNDLPCTSYRDRRYLCEITLATADFS